MATVFRNSRRQPCEWAIARILNTLTVRHKAALLATACVLATSGCASQNVRAGHGQLSSKTPATPHQSSQDRVVDSGAGPANSHPHRNGLKAALKNYYKKWKGVPYVYGGRSQNGIDCSSFVQHTYNAVESYELPRTTVQQARLGMSVSRSNLETGDLVFFKTGLASHHVGVYLGRGRFMHASSSQGVTISRLDNVYWRQHYWQSRRIVADTH